MNYCPKCGTRCKVLEASDAKVYLCPRGCRVEQVRLFQRPIESQRQQNLFGGN
jgi:hypothetical protein